MQRLAAVIAQALSYATTLGLAYHLIRPGDVPSWLFTIAVALGFEALFFGMKEAIFKPGVGKKAVGVIGFTLDGLINAGGILVIASRILTFAPLALMLGVTEVDLSDPTNSLIASVSISLFLGLTLSIVPHILWRDKRRPTRGDG